MTDIDARKFWSLVGSRATGAVVVTVDGRAGPAGFLGLSATHICAEPPTMMVSVDRRTAALADILDRRRFAISVLPAGSESMVDDFGGRTALKGTDRFEPGRWTTGEGGCPVLVGAVATIECEVSGTIDHHGSVLVFGTVVAGEIGGDRPLVLFRGKPLPMV